jgi:hypothetical protein
VLLGPGGEAVTEPVEVQLIALAGDGSVDSQETLTSGGRFEFAVAADGATSYVPRVVYEGVQYFGAAVRLAAGDGPAEVDVPVYRATAEAPELSIESSTMTVIALDRQDARLTIVREDVVLNPGDRTYVGGEDGVTLRLPLPDGTVEAGGLSEEGEFATSGGVITTTAPLRPGLTSVVTRYVVGYDRGDDAYTLRLTTPLPAQRLTIEVPERFVKHLHALDDSGRLPDTEFESEPLSVAGVETPVGPGGGVRARLEGLSGANEENALTERPGVVIGALLAIGALAGASALIARLARDRRHG